MGRTGILVVGPAGSGKSTFCFTLQNHLLSNKHRLQPKVVNLDPGQERTQLQEEQYPFDLDVRDLISVQDVMEELDFGPNGALVFCMEHLVQNMGFLEQGLDGIGGSDDEYFIFDCPGQIELYTHIPVISTIVEKLQSLNIIVCVTHVIDALFIDDTSKYISGALLSLTCMMQLKAPAINIITKCDIKKKTQIGGRPRRPGEVHIGPVSQYAPFLQNNAGGDPNILDVLEQREALAQQQEEQEDLGREASEFLNSHAGLPKDAVQDETEFLNVDDPEFFNPDPITLRASIQDQSGPPLFKHLSESICSVLENYNLVSFLPLDITDEESIDLIVLHLDNATQYGEDLEPHDPGALEEEEHE